MWVKATGAGTYWGIFDGESSNGRPVAYWGCTKEDAEKSKANGAKSWMLHAEYTYTYDPSLSAPSLLAPSLLAPATVVWRKNLPTQGPWIVCKVQGDEALVQRLGWDGFALEKPCLTESLIRVDLLTTEQPMVRASRLAKPGDTVWLTRNSGPWLVREIMDNGVNVRVERLGIDGTATLDPIPGETRTLVREGLHLVRPDSLERPFWDAQELVALVLGLGMMILGSSALGWLFVR